MSEFYMLDDEVFDLEAYLNPVIPSECVTMSMIESYYPNEEVVGPVDFTFFEQAQTFDSDSELSPSSTKSNPKPAGKLEDPCCRPMTDFEMFDLSAFLNDGPMATKALLKPGQRGAFSQYGLPTTGTVVHCVLWDGRYYITNIDILNIMKVLVQDDGNSHLPREESIDVNSRKFEETVYSVLRQLKVGSGCRLEEGGSDFLMWLAENGCIRTHKRQKIYHWEDVKFEVLAREIKVRLQRASKSPNLRSSPQCHSPRHPHYQPQIMPNCSIQKPRSADDSRKHYCWAFGCNRTFKRLEHLNRHARTHTGERPYSCTMPGCMKSFARSDNLSQHQIKVHGGIRMSKQDTAQSPSSMNSDPVVPYPESGCADLDFLDYLSIDFMALNNTAW